MVSKVNKNVVFGDVQEDENFDEFKAELYVPSSANSRNEPLKVRPFVFVDGEGVNHNGPDNPQSYVLLGASTGERLQGYDLSTVEIFQFLISLKEAHPDALFVGFGLVYDVNMWVKDLPENKVDERIRKAKRVQWGRYTILYMPKKIFQLTDRVKKITFAISDVVTFFTPKNFVDSCKEYLVRDEESMRIMDEVAEGKQGRNNFRYDELETIIKPYMGKELILGVQLMNRVRHFLFNAGIRPRGWHGPGAIASAVIYREGIKSFMRKPDRQIIEWSRRAYFGGRFEQLRTGFYDGPVWQYDINSAYPYALTFCPDLSTGEWVYRKEPTNTTGSQFKLYALRFKNMNVGKTEWNPLPLRSIKQTIHYQGWVEGIYWGPEAEIVLREFPEYVDIVGVYEFYDSGERPFGFVREMYELRKQWKMEGNPAQLALKLGYNSLYGKLAQRVGWDEKNNLPPKSHQLEWAGFTTSMCRAMMLEAMLQNPEAVIATETDGLFSTHELDLKTGNDLGEFEAEYWSGIVYIQNGVYFKRDGDEWQPGKTRGFRKNGLKIDDVMTNVETLTKMKTSNNRFNGMASISSGTWRTWSEHPTEVQWGGTGKRVHNAENCTGCHDGTTWHQTVWVPGGHKSQPHTLPWLDGFSNLFQLEEDNSEGLLEE